MAVDGRFRLDAFLGGERSHDVVDAVGPLLLGTDLTDNTAVLLRLAADNDASRSRLLREAVISAGLSHPQLLKVKAQTPTATVWSAPRGVTIDVALSAGLRIDDDLLRHFLASILLVLADLEAKSPPVHLRALHAGNVIVDDELTVTLIDFSRATDTLADGADTYTFRPGMTPPSQSGDVSPTALDQYAVGVLAVQMAARTAPSDLPRRREGRPDVNRSTSLSPPLKGFVDALLHASFDSNREALTALGQLQQQGKGARTPLVLAAAAALVIVVAGFVAVGLTASIAVPTPPLASAAPLWLTVTTNPADATVFFDGVKSAGHALAVVSGRHHVRAQSNGHRDAEALVNVAGATRVHLVLPPLGVETPIIDPMPKTFPPPKTDPPPKIDPPPKSNPPPTLPVPSVHDELLRAIERAVFAQREEIEACPEDGNDRIKLHLQLKLGTASVHPLARGDTDSVRCVADAVGVAVWPKTPHQQVDADVWVWRKPTFKVAAY